METKMDFESEHSLDFIVRVDRAIHYYPIWVESGVGHPELECLGPSEYDLRDIGQFCGKEEIAYEIYSKLITNGELANQLGFIDLFAIQQKGVVVFRQFFAGKEILGWRTVFRNRYGTLEVSYLFEKNGEILLGRHLLCKKCPPNSVALFFRA